MTERALPFLGGRKPPLPLAAGVCGTVAALWILVRVFVFHDVIMPLTYVIPLLVCVWARDRRLLWAMAAVFVTMAAFKMLWRLPHETSPKEEYAVFIATLVNVAAGGAIVHLTTVLQDRLEASLGRLAAANEELRAQSETLAQQNEELTQQTEELTQQSEELTGQNEEMQAQAEEIQSLNDDLARRENMLQRLLDATRLARSEQAVMRDVCAAAMEMFGAAASAVVVCEKQDARLVVRAEAGLGGAAPESWPLERSFAELVLREHRTACLEDATLRPDLSMPNVPGQGAFRAVLTSPLRISGQAFGVVDIYSREKREWTTEHFRLAEWLADQCARILETLRLQQALRQQAALIDLSPDGIVSRRLDGTITFWGQGAAAMYGWTRQEAIGQQTHSLLKTRFPQPLEEILGQVRQTGRWSGELVRQTKDGRQIVVQSCWLVHRHHSEETTEILESNMDITERKKAAEELRRTAEELMRSNRDLEQFAYIASHDLQEPLRIVTGYVQLLDRRYRSHLDADADKFIAYAVDGTTRMKALIGDLLTYSRAGTRDRAFALVDSDKVLRQVLDNLGDAIAESAAVVEHGPLPAVSGDETQLIQLFQNLIGNAIKFRDPARRPEVRIGARRDGARWLFHVRDNGIGIDPQYHDRIFQIFQRLHDRGKYPGTGIGLAVCKRIVERHGGRVWVDSQAGNGATFFFTIHQEVPHA